ncbi:MAG: dTMP kinase [Acetobacteraceae bacterium]|nr:dTMP kinase [Acetobacteraceae bacterium]
MTLEGGEGAGKSTQADLLARALEARGIAVLRTREPGGTDGAEQLRALLLAPGADWTPLAEMLLHFAARAEHVDRAIRPALAAGHWVVCDRFTDSTLAYQGYGQGADLAAIRALGVMIGLAPDRTIVLDIPEHVRTARLAARPGGLDRYELLSPPFHARVREGFRAIAAGEPERCVLIRGDGDEAAVHAAVLRAIERE